MRFPMKARRRPRTEFASLAKLDFFRSGKRIPAGYITVSFSTQITSQAPAPVSSRVSELRQCQPS